MNVFVAFGMALIAGLCTVVGSIVVLLVDKKNTNILTLSLAFAGGVMIYVSLVDILAHAQQDLVQAVGNNGRWVALLSFFCGMAVIAVIDIIFVDEEKIATKMAVQLGDANNNSAKLKRMGIMTAVAIAIHNLPEGIATFMSAINDVALAVPIVIAIALHNIPEGIAIASPIYYATGSKGRAILASLYSGLAEPIGALLAWLILAPLMSPVMMSTVLAMVAGIMVYISVAQLLPASYQQGKPQLTMYGIVAGMATMAISMVLLGA